MHLRRDLRGEVQAHKILLGIKDESTNARIPDCLRRRKCRLRGVFSLRCGSRPPVREEHQQRLREFPAPRRPREMQKRFEQTCRERRAPSRRQFPQQPLCQLHAARQRQQCLGTIAAKRDETHAVTAHIRLSQEGDHRPLHRAHPRARRHRPARIHDKEDIRTAFSLAHRTPQIAPRDDDAPPVRRTAAQALVGRGGAQCRGKGNIMLPRARGGVTHHTPARRARRCDAFPTAHAHCTSIACKVEDRHCHPRKGVKDRIRSALDGTLWRLCIVGIAAVLVRAFLRAFLGRRFVCVGIVPRRISRIGMLTLRCFLPLLLPARIVRILRVSVPIVAFRHLRGRGHLGRRAHAVRQDVERRLLHIGGQEIGASREGGNRACRLREKQLRAIARTAHPHDELRRKRAHRGGDGNIRKTLPRRGNRRAKFLLLRTIVCGK